MTRIAAALCASLYLWIAPAAAQSDGLKEGFKKTEKGAGELFRGMGQEINKLGGTLTAPSKDGKKAKAKKNEEKKD